MTITAGGTAADPACQESPAVTEGQPVRSRRRGAVLGLLSAVAGVSVGWWWSHPTVLGGVGGEFDVRPERLTPVYVDMAARPASGRFEVLGATPRVHVLGGEAETEVLLCKGAAIGIVHGAQGKPHCFSPAVTGEGAPWDQVVLKVTPADAGTVVVVDGIDLTYGTALQRGTEHAGWRGVIVFPAE